MVIKEYFQFYNMDYSNCVFASEANARTEVKRDQLIEKLGLAGKVEAGKPILAYVLEVRENVKFRNSKVGGCRRGQRHRLRHRRRRKQHPPRPVLRLPNRNRNRLRSNKNSMRG